MLCESDKLKFCQGALCSTLRLPLQFLRLEDCQILALCHRCDCRNHSKRPFHAYLLGASTAFGFGDPHFLRWESWVTLSLPATGHSTISKQSSNHFQYFCFAVYSVLNGSFISPPTNVNSFFSRSVAAWKISECVVFVEDICVEAVDFLNNTACVYRFVVV